MNSHTLVELMIRFIAVMFIMAILASPCGIGVGRRRRARGQCALSVSPAARSTGAATVDLSYNSPRATREQIPLLGDDHPGPPKNRPGIRIGQISGGLPARAGSCLLVLCY